MNEAAPDVVGRDDELAVIAGFLDAGPSPAAALVLEAEAGMGKTTLWLRAVELAAQRSYRVLSSRPAESDSRLSFAGVGDLLAGVLDEVLPELPGPQRSALEVALLLAHRAERTPDPGALAFGFLNSLRMLAVDSPIALAIDDVQWLDEPSARLVRFAAQRLHAEPVRLVLARRGGGGGRLPLELDQALPGRIRVLSLASLSLGALYELLRTRLGASLSRPTLRRLYQISGGNPLYALEIGRSLERLGGRVEPGETLPVPGDLHDLLRERLGALPERAAEALLVAALSSDPTIELVERVTGRRVQLQAAIDANVVTVSGGTLRFVHPLFAAAIEEEAGPERTQRLHRRLAEEAPSAEERALHLALGTMGVNDQAADELAHAARAARKRGSPIAAAAFFDHALRLSAAEKPDRVRWEIELAESSFEAGDATRAIELLAGLADRLPSGNARAEVLWRLAAVSGELGPPATTVGYYEDALQEVENNPALETRIHSDLTVMWVFANDLQRALAHGRKAVELSELLDEAEVKAEALASLAYVEFTAGLTLRPELIGSALALEEVSRHVRIDRSPSVVRGFQLLWTGELAEARSYFEFARRLALERGDESNLSISSYYLAILETIAGNWDSAAVHVLEAVELAEHTGVNRAETTYARALLDAHLGRAEPAASAARELLRLGEEQDQTITVVRSLAVLGFVELSRGDAKAARDWFARATELAFGLGIGDPGLLRFVPDHIEALVALGRVDEAGALLGRFERPAASLRRSWALATVERCRGLVLGAGGDLARAVAALERARDGHRRASMPFELGRTLLALGAAQRRARQRRAARESLEEALETFERLGAPLWAAKARGELGRIAGRAPASGTLTPAEKRIAELVARGSTNREVAAELVLTVHTVEATLTRVYAKLGVRSRTELARRFAEEAG